MRPPAAPPTTDLSSIKGESVSKNCTLFFGFRPSHRRTTTDAVCVGVCETRWRVRSFVWILSRALVPTRRVVTGRSFTSLPESRRPIGSNPGSGRLLSRQSDTSDPSSTDGGPPSDSS